MRPPRCSGAMARRRGSHQRRRVGQHTGRRTQQLLHHLFYPVRRIIVAESHLIDFRPHRRGTRQVAECIFVERNVGDDPQFTSRRLDVHRPPVDLNHLASCSIGDHPIANVQRSLEQQHQPGHDISQRFLQGQADHHRADTQGSQRVGQLVTPNLGVDEHCSDGDEQSTRQIPKEFWHTSTPRFAFPHAKDEVIHHSEQGVKQEDQKNRLNNPHGRAFFGQS